MFDLIKLLPEWLMENGIECEVVRGQWIDFNKTDSWIRVLGNRIRMVPANTNLIVDLQLNDPDFFNKFLEWIKLQEETAPKNQENPSKFARFLGIG